MAECEIEAVKNEDERWRVRRKRELVARQGRPGKLPGRIGVNWLERKSSVLTISKSRKASFPRAKVPSLGGQEDGGRRTTKTSRHPSIFNSFHPSSQISCPLSPLSPHKTCPPLYLSHHDPQKSLQIQ